MDLVVEGGALPTFLLDRIAIATGAMAVQARPPQMVVFSGAIPNAEFSALIPMIEAEKLSWHFVGTAK